MTFCKVSKTCRVFLRQLTEKNGPIEKWKKVERHFLVSWIAVKLIKVLQLRKNRSEGTNRELGYWGRALNAPKRTKGREHRKFCILTPNCGLKCLKITPKQAWKVSFMLTSHLTTHDVFKLHGQLQISFCDYSSWNLGATKKHTNGRLGRTYQS